MFSAFTTLEVQRNTIQYATSPSVKNNYTSQTCLKQWSFSFARKHNGPYTDSRKRLQKKHKITKIHNHENRKSHKSIGCVLIHIFFAYQLRVGGGASRTSQQQTMNTSELHTVLLIALLHCKNRLYLFYFCVWRRGLHHFDSAVQLSFRCSGWGPRLPWTKPQTSLTFSCMHALLYPTFTVDHVACILHACFPFSPCCSFTPYVFK